MVTKNDITACEGIPHLTRRGTKIVARTAAALFLLLIALAAGCVPFGPKFGSPYSEKVIKLNHDGACLAFSAADPILAAGTNGAPSDYWGGSVQLFDWSKSKELQSFVFDRRVTTVAFSKDGKRLAVGTGSRNDTGIPNSNGYQDKAGEIAVFDMPECRERKRLRLTAARGCWKLSFTSDGDQVLAMVGDSAADYSNDNELILLDVKSLEIARVYEQAAKRGGVIEKLCDFVISTDGRSIAVLDCSKPRIAFFDLRTGKHSRTLPEGPHERFGGLQFAPDGKSLFVGSRFWDVETGKAIPNMGTAAGVLSPDGKLVGSTHQMVGTFRYADVDLTQLSSNKTVNWKMDHDTYRALTFTPDTKWLAVTGTIWKDNKYSGAVVMWDITKKEP